jgi:hypothetical protein
MMKTLEYKLIQDRHKKPLITVESSIGNGQELCPNELRNLAAALAKIADEAEKRDMGKGYHPSKRTTTY